MVEGVFESYSCLNGSFLKSECHYGCSSTNHGVDIEKVKRAFIQINDYEKLINVENLIDIQYDDITMHHPEALRYLVIAPFYHKMMIPSNVLMKRLQIPFACLFLDVMNDERKNAVISKLQLRYSKKNNIYLIHFLTSCDCTFFLLNSYLFSNLVLFFIGYSVHCLYQI